MATWMTESEKGGEGEKGREREIIVQCDDEVSERLAITDMKLF